MGPSPHEKVPRTDAPSSSSSFFFSSPRPPPAVPMQGGTRPGVFAFPLPSRPWCLSSSFLFGIFAQEGVCRYILHLLCHVLLPRLVPLVLRCAALTLGVRVGPLFWATSTPPPTPKKKKREKKNENDLPEAARWWDERCREEEEETWEEETRTPCLDSHTTEVGDLHDADPTHGKEMPREEKAKKGTAHRSCRSPSFDFPSENTLSQVLVPLLHEVVYPSHDRAVSASFAAWWASRRRREAEEETIEEEEEEEKARCEAVWRAATTTTPWAGRLPPPPQGSSDWLDGMEAWSEKIDDQRRREREAARCPFPFSPVTSSRSSRRSSTSVSFSGGAAPVRDTITPPPPPHVLQMRFLDFSSSRAEEARNEEEEEDFPCPPPLLWSTAADGDGEPHPPAPPLTRMDVPEAKGDGNHPQKREHGGNRLLTIHEEEAEEEDYWAWVHYLCGMTGVSEVKEAVMRLCEAYNGPVTGVENGRGTTRKEPPPFEATATPKEKTQSVEEEKGGEVGDRPVVHPTPPSLPSSVSSSTVPIFSSSSSCRRRLPPALLFCFWAEEGFRRLCQHFSRTSCFPLWLQWEEEEEAARQRRQSAEWETQSRNEANETEEEEAEASFVFSCPSLLPTTTTTTAVPTAKKEETQHIEWLELVAAPIPPAASLHFPSATPFLNVRNSRVQAVHTSFATVLPMLPSSSPSPPTGASPVAQTNEEEEEEREAPETWEEVGEVLSALSTALSGRTLVDHAAYRYGRNQVSLAGVSYIGTVHTPPTPFSNGEASSFPSLRPSVSPTDAHSTLSSSLLSLPFTDHEKGDGLQEGCEMHTAGDHTTDREEVQKEEVVVHGVFFHETGTLYATERSEETGEGRVFAMEVFEE